MTQFDNRFRNSQRRSGQVVVLVALGLIVLIAMVGMAVDGGNLYLQKRNMQNAADAGAFAGARVLGSGNTSDRSIRYEIEKYAYYNHVTQTSQNVTAYYTDTSGTRISPLNNGQASLTPSNATGIEVVTSITFPTYFIAILRINSLYASATAAAKARSVVGPNNNGYAIFAKKSTASASKVIDWSGGNWQINGTVHSNSDINMSGTGNAINGMVESVIGVSPSGLTNKATLTPATNNPVQSTVIADPVNKTLADFYQGTSSTSTYKYIDMGGSGTSNLSSFLATDATGNKYFPPGIYYVNGNVNFSTGLSTTTPSNVTIIATGSMTMSSPSMNFTPYSKGVTFFANADDSSAPGKIALSVSGSNGAWNGILYAPNSGINLSGSSNTSFRGSVVGNTVKLSGSSGQISYDSQYFPGTTQAEIILYK